MNGRNLHLCPIDDWGFFPGGLKVIAGPCSAETRSQVLSTAEALARMGIKVFRAGIWKPRTHPGTFEGVGSEGLDWLAEAGALYGLKVCTEVASEKHVRECLEHGLDMVWLGARTTANPFMVQEIADALAGTDIPVLVKNPVNPDIDLWIGALERLNRAGVTRLAAVHRGVSSTERIPYRNAPQWDMAVELRACYPQLPIFADPSHMGGSRDYLPELSQRALDLGLDGLMLECHRSPGEALSDSAQQVSPSELGALLDSLQVRTATSADEAFGLELERLRAQIDVIDEDLLADLAARMEVSEKIGAIKREHGVAIIQAGRWDKVLEKVGEGAKKYGLDRSMVQTIFNIIHDASVDKQNR